LCTQGVPRPWTKFGRLVRAGQERITHPCVILLLRGIWPGQFGMFGPWENFLCQWGGGGYDNGRGRNSGTKQPRPRGPTAQTQAHHLEGFGEPGATSGGPRPPRRSSAPPPLPPRRCGGWPAGRAARGNGASGSPPLIGGGALFLSL